MQGLRRRVVFVVLYEGIAVASTSLGLAAVSGGADHLASASFVAVGSSAIAIVWNLAFNWIFERWEARQPVRGRSLGRRIAHALGFEGGLAVMLIPLVSWGLGVTLAEAFLLDLGLLGFFLFYTFAFNWAFDRIFGLPASAA